MKSSGALHFDKPPASPKGCNLYSHEAGGFLDLALDYCQKSHCYTSRLARHSLGGQIFSEMLPSEIFPTLF